MKEIDKLKAGLEYCFTDKDVENMKVNAVKNCQIYNSLDDTDLEAQYELLCKMLGSVGENVWIGKRFNCDNGKNIFIGDNFIANFNLTILDIAEVHIGDNVMFGPNVLVTSVGHPLSPKKRRQQLAQASEIKIAAERIIKIKDKLNNILANVTKKDIKIIEQDTERDNFMDPKDALKYGLIDKIIT